MPSKDAAKPKKAVMAAENEFFGMQQLLPSCWHR